jgi:hypothetical protein
MPWTHDETAARAISVDDYEFLANSVEVARMWVEDGGPATCLIQPERLANPEMFGMLMVDAIRHAAVAFGQCYAINEEEALRRIWRGLDAERDFETSPIETIQNYQKRD